MPFQAVKPRRLYQEVADQISALIDAGEISPGDRLPSERDLSARFEVSRATIREAMIALEIAGVVEIRTGSGIYVLAAKSDQPVPTLEGDDAGPGPFELIEARLLFEPEAAALAAQRISPEGVKRLERTIDDMEKLIQAGKSAEDADHMFHYVIAESTQNSAILAAVETLWTMRSGMPMWRKLHEVISELEHQPDWTDDRRAVEDHRRILAAIRTRDADRARQTMQDHLSRVRRVLLEASEMGQVF